MDNAHRGAKAQGLEDLKKKNKKKVAVQNTTEGSSDKHQVKKG